MEVEAIKGLPLYGPIGVLALILLLAVIRLYRDKVQAEKDHKKEVEAMQTSHKAEMQTLMERYITKSETWMQKYQELSTSMTTLVDSMQKKFR